MIANIEQYILGACYYEESVNEIVQSVSASDFTNKIDQKIFHVIEKLVAQGVMPEPLAIVTEDKSIPASYAATLMDECPTAVNIGFFLDKFHENAAKTRYLRLGRTLSTMAEGSPDDMFKEIEAAISTKRTTQAEHISKPLKRALDSMEHAYENRGMITGVPTGIRKIDDELSGLHKTDMILVAARPSIGKTALALQIAENASVKRKVSTLFISLEMSSEQLAARMLLSKSGISVSKARNGLFTEADWPKLTMTAGAMNESPLLVDDCAGATIEVIAAKAKAAKMKDDIGLLVIDYIGLIGGSGTEYERVTNASRSIKLLAQQLKIPVVALHQLNRSNLGGKPTMNELRSSGQLEQDADVIILLHREKKEPTEPCDLIIEKNRHGKTGLIKQTWVGHLNRIEELT